MMCYSQLLDNKKDGIIVVLAIEDLCENTYGDLTAFPEPSLQDKQMENMIDGLTLKLMLKIIQILIL